MWKFFQKLTDNTELNDTEKIVTSLEKYWKKGESYSFGHFSDDIRWKPFYTAPLYEGIDEYIYLPNIDIRQSLFESIPCDILQYPKPW